MKWDYLVHRMTNESHTVKNEEDLLKAQGDNSWELVSVVSYVDEGQLNFSYYYKRPLVKSKPAKKDEPEDTRTQEQIDAEDLDTLGGLFQVV